MSFRRFDWLNTQRNTSNIIYVALNQASRTTPATDFSLYCRATRLRNIRAPYRSLPGSQGLKRGSMNGSLATDV